MTPEQLIALARQALADPDATLPDPETSGELAPVAELLGELIDTNRKLTDDRQEAIDYIRHKVDQLLVIIGTIPLRSEELDDKTLIRLDPIGIIGDSFSQILNHVSRTKDKLTMALEEIKAIFEAVGGGIVVLDQNLRIVSYNRSFEKMFANSDMEIEGRTCLEVVGSERNTCPAFDEMMRTGSTATIADMPLHGRHYSIVTSPVRDIDGNIVRAVMLYLDITDLISVRAELAAEKERLQITLESIAEGVIATDTEGHVHMMNRVAEKLTGWDKTQAEGKPICEVLSILKDNTLKSCLEMLSGVLSEYGGSERLDNTIMVTQDGDERLIDLSAAPIIGQDDTIAGVILVFRDTTNDKKLEEEMIKATRIDSLGLLAGGIAHDFNNLLTTILGNIGLTAMAAKGQPEFEEQLEQAQKACLRARDITQQLLTFAKGGEPTRMIAHLADLVKDNVEFALRGSIIASDILIDDDIWPVEVDTGQVSQVLNNLVINAKQAMPQGGTIRVQVRNVTIARKGPVPLEQGRYVQIRVTDQGMGIPPEHLSRIFDPYFTTKQTGSGLGLASSFAIVKKHDGHLGVDSKMGQGATFTLYLPAIVGKKSEEKAKLVDEKPLDTINVLVMDDDESIRDLIVQMLNQVQFPATAASDGKQAIELYKTAKHNGSPFDVVIMDLTVTGGMGGQEAMAELVKFDPEIKAIVSSGYSTDAVMSEYEKYGFKAVMPKPFEFPTLISTIRQVMAKQKG